MKTTITLTIGELEVILRNSPEARNAVGDYLGISSAHNVEIAIEGPKEEPKHSETLTEACQKVMEYHTNRDEGCKIPVIKKIREKTGACLIEARNAYEAWEETCFTGQVVV